MSLLRGAFGQQKRGPGDTQFELVPSRIRNFGTGSVRVDGDSAMRHSAVWACRTLRANLVSATPLDVFRRVNGYQVEVPKPLVLRLPGGARVGLPEWLYSSEMDLSGWGNVVGIITKRDGNGLPAEIELQAQEQVKVTGKGPHIEKFIISGKVYDKPEDIWHEKGPTVSGSPMGLSPIVYAAWSIGGYLSAQQYANDWFSMGPNPKGVLKHKEQDVLPDGVADEVKGRFKATTANGDIFVTGAAWEWTPETTTAQGAAFLDEMKYGAADVCRFFGVPADMIDAGTSGSAITYSNVTQRNLQFLIMNLGPSFARREWAFSEYLLQQPRYVKFQTDALLRMDPETRTKLLGQQVKDRILTPTEAREVDNRLPYTEADYEQFERLFGRPGMKYTITIPETETPIEGTPT